MRTRCGTAILVTAALIALGGCSSDGSETTVPEPAATSDTQVPEPTNEPPQDEPAPSEPAGLPARADMDEATRALAEGVFLDLLEGDPTVGSAPADQLLAAGTAACDAMDAGAAFRDVLIAAAIVAPDVTEIEGVTSIAGVAGGALCPEHLDYVG